MFPLFMLARTAHAITGGTAPDTDDLRFDAVAAFSEAHLLGQGANPTDDHNWYCSAVLIDSTHILTAGHCIADQWDRTFTVRFRRHTDGTLGTKAAGPSSYHHVDVTVTQYAGDLALGTLATPVTHIDPIPVLTQGFESLDEDLAIIHAGWGKEGPGDNQGPRNELLLCDNTAKSSTETHLTFFPTASNPNACGVNMHDSGSPALVENAAGDLRMIATVVSYGSSENMEQHDGDAAIVHSPYLLADLTLDGSHGTEWIDRGDSFDVELYVQNAGMFGQSYGEVDLYLHDDLGETSLLSQQITLSASFQTHTLTVPSQLSYGTYRVRAAVDEAGSVGETFEGNNAFEGDELVTVNPTVRDLADGRLFAMENALFEPEILWVTELDDGTWSIAMINLTTGDGEVAFGQVPTPSGVFLWGMGSGWVVQKTNGKFSLINSDPARVILPSSSVSGTGVRQHHAGVYSGATTSGDELLMMVDGDGTGILGIDGEVYYGDLDALSGTWGTSSLSWSQTEQAWQVVTTGTLAGSATQQVLP